MKISDALRLRFSNHMAMTTKGQEKEALEIQKTELEIKSLPKNWYQRNFTSFVTLFVALGTIGVGWFSGLFDAKYAILELRKERLLNEIHQFNASKDSVKLVTELLLLEKDSIEQIAARRTDELRQLNEHIVSSQLELLNARAALQPVAERAAYYEREAALIKQDSEAKRSKYVDILSKQNSKEYELEKQNEAMIKRIERYESDSVYHQYLISWYKENPHIPEKNKFAFDKYVFDKQMEYSNQRRLEIEQDMNERRKKSEMMNREFDSIQFKMKLRQSGVDMPPTKW